MATNRTSKKVQYVDYRASFVYETLKESGIHYNTYSEIKDDIQGRIDHLRQGSY